MYSELNLDLQAFAKRVYDSILYQSTFYRFLNTAYIGELRQTGAPVIEIAKTNALSVNVRETKEIQSQLTPSLVTYGRTMVDLTELNMDYSIRVPLMITGSDITNAVQDAADLQDAAIAEQIDTYGYGKLAAASMDDLDVVFPLINYAGLGIRKGEEFGTKEEMMEAIAECHKAGKGVFSMKAFGGGGLTGHYQEALDYIFAQPEIESAMIGFGKIKEVDDLLSYLNGSMDPTYNPDISKKKVHINHEDCEGCGACKAACPAGAIYYNLENGLAEVDHEKCLTCGYCSPVCPVRAVIMY